MQNTLCLCLESSYSSLTSIRGKKKIEKIYSGVWSSLPPLDPRTYRAIGLTQLSLDSYLGHPILDNITQFYFTCFRNPSCFKDLHRFVALLSVDEQRKFQTAISEHAQSLGTMTKESKEGTPETDTKVRHTLRVFL